MTTDAEIGNLRGRPRGFVRGGAAALAALVVAGCATQPAPEPVKPAPPPPAVVVPEPPKPAPPPEPQLTPAQAKAQAQKLTLDSITQLQNGDEPAAQKMLEQALTLDPANDLAKKLMEQIKADPQKELGTVFFRYTVQRDDSLSKIAQQFMGDRFKFHILAKYNDIPNPSRLAAGQVIKIPGRAPPPGAAAPPRATPTPAAPEAPEAAAVTETPTPRTASMALMQQGQDLQKSGNLEGAYDAFREAAVRDPGNRDAVLQRDATRQQLARRYEREATQAFQRQNLDESIAKWDRVLALEPGNQKAKLERERAIDLRKKLNEKFGK
ncbi:MAG: LysM domain-containing protein [Burkholderiales bacterium]